jgi:PKD repeat protein
MKALKILAAALGTVALTACAGHEAVEAPPLSGPSGLSQLVTVSAIPDTINFDGGSQASVRISASGANGRPAANLSLRVDMFVNGTPQDFGTLSARTVATNADGIATVIYTAPPTPPGSNFGTCNGLAGTCVEIVATPSGTAFDAANPQSVRIRLVPPGVIVAPGSTPTANFTINPATVALNDAVVFDGSGSLAGAGATQIVSYDWTFGDGASANGRVVTHAFRTVGVSNNVTLTVTNDLGLTSSLTKVVAVGNGALPTPLFSTSPTGPVIGQAVFFNAAQSTPGAGHTIVTYRWAFGDGATGSGITVSHPYAVAATYNVQLTVVDEAGQTATSSPTSISVTLGNPTAVLALIKQGPSPAPLTGQRIQADGSASTATGTSTIVTYTFIWGDGKQDVSTNPVFIHDYPPPASGTLSTTFTVTLRVTDNNVPPRTGTASQAITVP